MSLIAAMSIVPWSVGSQLSLTSAGKVPPFLRSPNTFISWLVGRDRRPAK
jgi:hypothetical protein